LSACGSRNEKRCRRFRLAGPRSGSVACDECDHFVTLDVRVSEHSSANTDATELAVHFRDVDDAIGAAERAGWDYRLKWRCPGCQARSPRARVASG
jgi:hypothetical protein